MTTKVIVILVLCEVATFIIGFLIGKAMRIRVSDGVLKIDKSGEKDLYNFELWVPLADLEKRESIHLRVRDIS